MAEEYYPYFKLSFTGQSDNIIFQEISGISKEILAEELYEGDGKKREKIALEEVGYENLIIKKAVAGANSDILKWCSGVIDSDMAGRFSAQTITVTLMNEQGDLLKAWNFVNALPVKCVVSGPGLSSKEVVVESIEFAYNYFSRHPEYAGNIRLEAR